MKKFMFDKYGGTTMDDINVLLHDLVPEHEILSEKEAEVVLKELKITANQLPKIRKDDPVLRTLQMAGQEIYEGLIIKITRKSESARVSVVYRMIVERVK
jgi:DNA-directed RNA polymerase subunit H (RpoH/RPB5)